MRIRYTEWGSGDEVIILLHDTAEAGMVWASLARRLADLGCRIIAPDMRGTPNAPRLPFVVLPFPQPMDVSCNDKGSS